MMKKGNRIITFILILVTITSSYLFYDSYNQKEDYEKEIIRLEEEINELKSQKAIPVDSNLSSSNENDRENRLIKLTLEELEQKISDKETFILVITQTNCGHCISYKPTLNEVLEETSQIAYEIDIQPLSKDDKERVYNIARISGTPTTVFIVNGEEKDTSTRLIGSVSKDKIKERLKETGYIN